MTTQQLTSPPSVPVLSSTVLAVVMRVAGPVPTLVHPHAIGEPEQQVTAHIGDAVVYLTEPTVAGRIRQQWDAAQYLAATRLPERVSQTWLAPTLDTYPSASRSGRPDLSRSPPNGSRDAGRPALLRTCGYG